MPRKSAKPVRRAPTRENPGSFGRELLKANRELSAQLRTLRANHHTLQEARAHYADLFDFAPVTYALLDAIGMVLKVNLSGCRLLNTERVHLIGHPLLPF